MADQAERGRDEQEDLHEGTEEVDPELLPAAAIGGGEGYHDNY